MEIALSMSESASELDSSADSVAPSVYIGQFGQLLEQGDTVTMQPYVITFECVEHYCQLYHFFYLQINAFYFHHFAVLQMKITPAMLLQKGKGFKIPMKFLLC